MSIGYLTYAAVSLGVYLVVAQDRGRMVGAISAIIWPVIFGMLAGYLAMKSESEMDWSIRVTWMPDDNTKEQPHD